MAMAMAITLVMRFKLDITAGTKQLYSTEPQAGLMVVHTVLAGTANYLIFPSDDNISH